MNSKTIILWIVSLLFVCMISVILARTRSCHSDNKPDISTIQRMGNDIKWTRCFRAADGTIYFEDHKMSVDGGKTVIAQQAIDVEDINTVPERGGFLGWFENKSANR